MTQILKAEVGKLRFTRLRFQAEPIDSMRFPW